jgi:hypothetical protein
MKTSWGDYDPGFRPDSVAPNKVGSLSQTGPPPKFFIKQFLYENPCVVGRGTTVYEVNRVLEGETMGHRQVLKWSWLRTSLPREADIISFLVKAIPQWRDRLPEVSFLATYT